MRNDRLPLYLQIQDYFKEQISSEKLLENDRISTEKEIMEQFNVSRITVANALSGLAKEGWIYRIPGRGSFVKERIHGQIGNQSLFTEPQSMKIPTPIVTVSAPKKRVIGLIMPSIGDYFAIRLLQGITQVVNDSDFQLIIMLTLNSQEREQYAIKESIRMGAEGLLIFPSDGEVYNEEILALKIQGFPFVLVDRYLPGIETNFICSDGSFGAQLAVSHLWELGHRDIAICSDVPMPTVSVEERISGYMKELKARGALINPAHILTDIIFDNMDIQEDHPFFRYIISGLATAYIALNGKQALIISHIVKKLGKRVPEDISIVTFDDPTPGYDHFGTYTHIEQSEERMGRDAANILIELLADGKDNRITGYQKAVIKPRIVVCGSTGPVQVQIKT